MLRTGLAKVTWNYGLNIFSYVHKNSIRNIVALLLRILSINCCEVNWNKNICTDEDTFDNMLIR